MSRDSLTFEIIHLINNLTANFILWDKSQKPAKTDVISICTVHTRLERMNPQHRKHSEPTASQNLLTGWPLPVDSLNNPTPSTTNYHHPHQSSPSPICFDGHFPRKPRLASSSYSSPVQQDNLCRTGGTVFTGMICMFHLSPKLRSAFWVSTVLRQRKLGVRLEKGCQTRQLSRKMLWTIGNEESYLNMWCNRYKGRMWVNVYLWYRLSWVILGH